MIGSWIEFCPPQAVIVSSIEVWNFKNQYWYPGIFSPHVKNNRYSFPLLIHLDTVFKKIYKYSQVFNCYFPWLNYDVSNQLTGIDRVVTVVEVMIFKVYRVFFGQV